MCRITINWNDCNTVLRKPGVFICIAIWGFATPLKAQSKVDSLLASMAAETNQQQVVKYHLDLVMELRNSDLQAAFDHVWQALAIAKQSEYLHEVGTAQSMAGLLYSYTDKLDSAVYWNRSAIPLLSSFGDSMEMARNYNWLGVDYLLLQDNKNAAEYSLLAVKWALTAKLKANAFNNLGMISKKNGDYDQAMAYYLKALQNYELINEPVSQARTMSNLGSLYVQKKDYKRAQELFEESYAISEKTGNAECLAQALCGLGITTSHKGDRKKAILYLSRAADIFEKSGKMKDYAQQLVSMAGLQGAAGYYHVSESNYLKAEKIMLAQNDQYSLSVLYNNIADLYIQQKKLKKAVKYLEQAYACSKGYTDLNYNRLIVKNLSSIYETLGDSKRALKYRKLYEELNDEMVNVAENVKYVGLNHAFEIHKKEKQLVQKDLQIKEMKTTGKLNYILIAILCLSVFVVLFLYRRRIRRQLALEQNISSIARQISSLKLENSDLRVKLMQTESE